MKIFLIVLFTCSIVFGDNLNDKLINTHSRVERESCTKSGYCYCYGYKSGKPSYGYRYGFCHSCSGYKERTITIKTYINSKTKKEFQETETGSWRSCQ